MKAADLGIFANTFGTSTTVAGITGNSSVTAILLGITGHSDQFYFGGRVGLGLRTLSASAGGSGIASSGNTFAFGVVGGIRFPLASRASFRFETMWLSVLEGTIET